MTKHLVKNNPRGLRAGTKLILVNTPNAGGNGSLKVVGDVYETISNTSNSTTIGQVQVKNSIGQIIHFYYSSPADTFILADRKSEAKYLKLRLKELNSEMEDIKVKIHHLEMFDSEEEYVAYKLAKILEASNDPKDNVKAIAEVLKTMKETNLL